jgi:hypothetical protein
MGATALFHVALAAGAPWGQAAWGGQHAGVLPRPLRHASGLSAAALGTLVMLTATPPLRSEQTQRRILLGACGYFAVGTALNAASRSAVERALWTPVAATTSALLWRAAHTRS